MLDIKANKMVATKRNAKGELIEYLVVETMPLDKAKALKDEHQKYVAKCEKEQVKAQAETILKAEQEKRKVSNRDYCLAKVLFNDGVEKGLLKTNSDFETMFDNFLLGGEFKKELAPSDYLRILGRLS